MIIGRLVVNATVKLESPLLIGAGSNDHADVDVITNCDGVPYIPGTSFAGAVRGYFHPANISLTDDPDQYESLFGSPNNASGKKALRQSRFLVSDWKLEGKDTSKVVVRDGIKLCRSTGIVEDGKKYDYQVVEKDAAFSGRIEIPYGSENEKQFALTLISALFYELNYYESGKPDSGVSDFTGLRFGAKTNAGFGKVTLMADKTVVLDYDFSDKRNLAAWLTRNPGVVLKVSPKAQPRISTDAWIEGTFKLSNSIIFRSYSTNPADPDAVSFKSSNAFVMPGTGVKGAVSSRAGKILKTLAHDSASADRFYHALFGFVDESGKNVNNAAKGRIRVEESILPDFVAELQTRIKIDRFTGGTIESALFDSMPLFGDPKKNNQSVKIRCEIRKAKPEEIGLLLLVMKDIWAGDLAFGGEKNVGRGVFSGGSIHLKTSTGDDVIFRGTPSEDAGAITRFDHYIKALHQSLSMTDMQEGGAQ